MGIKDRCFEPNEEVAKGPELPCLALAEDASTVRGVSRTSFRNCWLFITGRWFNALTVNYYSCKFSQYTYIDAESASVFPCPSAF